MHSLRAYHSRAAKRSTAAFTLIELLAVMSIIVLLAGLVLGIARHAQYKSSLAKAQTEIKAFESAIEAYKIDNGLPPRDPSTTNSTTDNLNPVTDFDPASNSKYRESSRFLYRALSGFQPGADGAVGSQSPSKGYFTFQPNQLEIYPGSTQTFKNTLSPDMYIVDPFGLSYGYSTAYQQQADIANQSNTTVQPGFGYNPTYDLWSTAGYSQRGGMGTPSTNNSGASTAAVYSSLWLKNW